MDYVEMMMKKTQNNKELAKILFKKLFFELPQQVIKIRVAVEKDQLALAEDIIHNLHGSVSFCGFTDIQHVAKNLELSCTENNLIDAKQYFQVLERMVGHFLSKEYKILEKLENF